MTRQLRYVTRPILVAIDEERRRARQPDKHEHPPFSTLPKSQHLPLVFAHPLYSHGVMRALVLWPGKDLAWWVDVPLTRWHRLPRMSAEDHEFRF